MQTQRSNALLKLAPMAICAALAMTFPKADPHVDESALQEVAIATAAADPGETAPPPGTKPPHSNGNGTVPGVALADGSLVFYCKDALIEGFDWFSRLKGWFPSAMHTSHSVSPNHELIDMAYAKEGRMTFKNVVVPTTGTYRMTVRYAFAGGLFGGINDRPMGVTVNGADVTDAMSFPITHSFSVYANSSISIALNAGVNEIVIRAVNDHGVSRVDTVTLSQ